MAMDDLLVDAKLADLDREMAHAALARTLIELYGPCRCPRPPQNDPAACPRHAVDPNLFRRLVWAGLGS